MKSVQAAHSWLRVSENWDGETSFLAIETLGGMGFEASRVALSGGLAIVVGVNSAGKSRLLRMIRDAHGVPSAELSVEWNGPPPDGADYIDIPALVERQRAVTQTTTDIEDLVDQ